MKDRKELSRFELTNTGKIGGPEMEAMLKAAQSNLTLQQKELLSALQQPTDGSVPQIKIRRTIIY